MNKRQLNCLIYILGDNPTNKNSITFKLQIKCSKNRSAPSNATDPEELYINSKGKC